MLLAKICTAYYFAYFLIILPLLSRIETPGRCRPASRKACSASQGHGVMAGQETTMMSKRSILAALVLAVTACRRWPSAQAAEGECTESTSRAGASPACSAPTTRTSCSAASRCSAKSAPAATALDFIAFRNLSEAGGPEFSEAAGQGAGRRVRDRRSRPPKAAMRAGRSGRPLAEPVRQRAG